MKIKQLVSLFSLFILTQSCDYFSNPNDKMVKILEARNKMYNVKDNPFAAKAEVAYYDSIIKSSDEGFFKLFNEINKGNALLKLGKEAESVATIENAINRKKKIDGKEDLQSLKFLAIAYMRLGEKQNCVNYHNPESCTMPIQKNGIHTIRQGSQKAIEIYKKLLSIDPNDYESRWLLNIAYMTLGGYPLEVPKQWLIPNLNKDSGYSIKPFLDVAANAGIIGRNMSGGVIVDDFNNDNYLDIVTSDWSLDGVMHYYENDKKGKYLDYSKVSEIGRFKGGLNMIQADYDNDGDIDIFVLRGAWMRKYGRQPNSLLRNNGDGTFTDVTLKSGLYSEFPTQAGTWNDFNNDGYLDLFIGNESSDNESYPSELYLNNQHGTFTNVAKAAKCDVIAYIKGVTSADYDNDGDIDLFLSGMNKRKTLLKNTGLKKGIPQFKDVTDQAGLAGINVMTFPTWFWDYDNDGWQDIFVCGYQYNGSIAGEIAMEALNIPNESSKMYLYHNNHDGTFSDVSEISGLSKTVFAMGSNFGDIDNDGFLDMYLGTGNPDYRSLAPNRLFRNMGNGKFADVTVSGRVGNLQKGHGVAINDLDNDGDNDIFIEVGGAYLGDSFSNSLYLNPGQNNNRWIKLKLEGTESNRSAIGTKVKVTFKENGVSRSVYRILNSGGSFGASALRMEIGIGKATTIDQIEITWPKDQKKKVFKNVKPNQYIKIIEGEDNFSKIDIKRILFSTVEAHSPICI
ncbi:VCBS repeat-containing protein [Flavobacterium sp. MR2016-29]|uniref:FG-GAP-like repeat-containing protein n=1 Tax=Flavobacterium sp. MR2016-29 TaxID=2783795 RepID=UPI00188B4375|nr:FG-GAP-like repeat-containing protein [Flavobacterium sp. MR2016-29]MBF4494532.1 VCBS repeat-containing protein [Flavobacterium sp. MR2016-29]